MPERYRLDADQDFLIICWWTKGVVIAFHAVQSAVAFVTNLKNTLNSLKALSCRVRRIQLNQIRLMNACSMPSCFAALHLLQISLESDGSLAWPYFAILVALMFFVYDREKDAPGC